MSSRGRVEVWRSSRRAPKKGRSPQGGPTHVPTHENARRGVTRDQLKAALAAVADQRPDFRAVREQFWADFASGLGVSPETLRAAIQKVREEKSFKHHGDGNDFTEALAAELGVEPAKVTEAWQAAKEKAKATLAAQRDAWVSALAAQLGVDKEKVAAALAQCGGANRFARGH